MTNTTTTTAWTVKRINFFYSGTFNARQDDYIRRGDAGDYLDAGRIIAVDNKAAAERIAAALDDTGTYYLAHGEYERPDFVARRIKADPARVDVVTEEDACRLLDLTYDLETAEAA